MPSSGGPGGHGGHGGPSGDMELSRLREEVEQLRVVNMEEKMAVDNLMRERDFYFNKLRDIEILCQNYNEESDRKILDDVLSILYKTEVSWNRKNRLLQSVP